jgi:hypothetical protein
VTELETLRAKVIELADRIGELEIENERLRRQGQRQALQALSDEGQYEENYQARLAAETERDKLRRSVDEIMRGCPNCHDDWLRLQDQLDGVEALQEPTHE